MKSIDKALVVWFIVAILIFGGLITFGFFYKNKVNKYEKYEKVLIDGCKSYISSGNRYPKEGETINIDIDDLIKNGYINKKDVIKSCSGNIKVSRNKNITYKANIKCKYYHSMKK